MGVQLFTHQQMFNRRPGLWTLCTVFTGDREWLHTPQPPSSQPGTTCKWQFGLTRARCTSDHQTNWMEVIFDLFPTIHRTIYIVSSKMALCTTAQVFRIEHNCTKEFWSSVLCKLSTYGRVSHWERWEEDARTSQNLYHYSLFINIYNWIVSIPCSWIEAFQPPCCRHY